MTLPPLDTEGTRYTVADFAQDTWVFGEWESFLREQGLHDLSSFLTLKGEVVDRNRRSVVYRITLGSDKKIFYLKIHKDYYRQNLRTLYRKIPVLSTELTNLMHYGRAGIDTLEPVAWGYQPSPVGGDGFLLLEELAGFCSLREWLATPRQYNELQSMATSCGIMARTMHRAGLAHIDLYSWHIFVKDSSAGYQVVPIDLERTKVQSKIPLSALFIRLKQFNDLAVLHLTVAWPQVSDALRMKFFLMWLETDRLSRWHKMQARFVIQLSRYLAKKRKKFRQDGMAARLLRSK